jgi:hypothetical protein
LTELRESYNILKAQSLTAPDCVTLELTRREAALIRRLRELMTRQRDFFVIEITQTGFIWREVGKREG